MAGKNDLPKDYIITGVQVLDDKIVGEGAYGVVKLGRYYGLLCAVKKLKASMFPAGMKRLDQQTELILQSFYNECDKLSVIRHPNVVQLLGVFADPKTHLPVIVMELMRESLSRLLYRTKSLPLYAEVTICHDVAQALAYLHSFRPPIVHRDLSSNNILLSRDYHAKITDLGVAKVAKGSFLNWDDTPAPGTLPYMPPEVRKVPADLSPAMDVFALGVNILQIRTHKFPRPGPEFVSGRLGFSKLVPEKERRKDHLDLISRSHLLKPLLLDCLRDNPRDRPSGLQLCERFDKIESSKQYLESQQLADLKDTEVESIKQQITTHSQKITQLSEALTVKNAELEIVQCDLERERQYTAQLLEEKARERLKEELDRNRLLQSPKPSENGLAAAASPTGARKKKRRFSFKFPKLHYRRRRTAAAADTTAAPGSQSEQVNSFHKDAQPGDHDYLPKMVVSKTASPRLQHTAVDSHEPKSNHRQRQKQHATSSLGDSMPAPTPPKGRVDVAEVTLEADEMEDTKMSYKVNKLVWYSHNALPEGLQGSTLRVHECDGKLYVCCGALENGTPNKSVYYSSVRNVTVWNKALPEAPQYYSASTIVHGELVLISGLSTLSGKCTGNISSYDGRANIWVQRFPPLPTPRSSAAAFAYGEYLIVVGGQNDDGDPLNTVEVLHLPTLTWETAAKLPVRMIGQSIAVCGDTVYLVGGSDGRSCVHSVFAASVRAIVSSCHRFSLLATLASNIWRQLCECPFTKMTAICSGNQLLAFGGEEVTKAAGNVAAAWIWIYDPSENTWTPVQGMPSARKLCCAVMLSVENRLILIGGDPVFNTIDITEIV